MIKYALIAVPQYTAKPLFLDRSEEVCSMKARIFAHDFFSFRSVKSNRDKSGFWELKESGIAVVENSAVQYWAPIANV